MQLSFYYIDKSIAPHFSPTVYTNDRGRAGNDVINILTSEDMENTLRRVPDVVSYEFYAQCIFQ